MGRFVAGSSARAKASSLGIADESQEVIERRERAAALKPKREVVRLLGRDVPVVPVDDGTLRAVFRSVGALSITASLLFSAAVWIAGMCGLLVGGLLVDRVGRRRLLCVGAMAAGCACRCSLLSCY